MPDVNLREALRVYVIIDYPLPRERALLNLVRAVLDGGATMLQLRAKTCPRREIFDRVCDLLAFIGGVVPLIVNDHLDIALAAGAAGVHLGPKDLPVAAARKLSRHGVIGASAPSPEAALERVREGADYLGVGALFEARDIKPDASAPRGVAQVQRVRSVTSCPMVGIGGISLQNAADVVAAGADGVAVIRAVCWAADPRSAVAELHEQVWAALASRPSGGGCPVKRVDG